MVYTSGTEPSPHEQGLTLQPIRDRVIVTVVLIPRSVGDNLVVPARVNRLADVQEVVKEAMAWSNGVCGLGMRIWGVTYWDRVCLLTRRVSTIITRLRGVIPRWTADPQDVLNSHGIVNIFFALSA